MLKERRLAAEQVAAAIERNDLSDLKDELGDLLLQVVFHARMAQEQGLFGFDDVARAINDKMVRRHPHVFADESYASLSDQKEGWEEIKAAERKDKGRAASILDDVPVGLPALTRAVKLSKRAAKVGFVWPSVNEVVAKLHEEVAELEAEIAAGIVLIGCVPCGLASNVISFLAKANLALSITLTAVTTLLAPVVTPLLMKLLAGQFVQIEASKMMWDIVKMAFAAVTVTGVWQLAKKRA